MPYETKICVVCGKEFMPKIYYQIYCCKSCSQKAVNKAAKEVRANNPAKGICNDCGKEFIKMNGNQRYCCDECKKSATRKSKQKYRKRNELLFGSVRTKTVFIGYEGLAESIVFQAIQDYQENLLRIQRHPDNNVAKSKIYMIEKFFRSRWYGIYVSIHPTLSLIDPETVIYQLRKGVTE